MLRLTVSGRDFFDDASGMFLSTKSETLNLEHSLISVSKWEMKWRKPFLTEGSLTVEEFRDYIRCMTINQPTDPLIYSCITEKQCEEIMSYMQDPATATWFREDQKKGGRQVVTSELIYYWMTALNIPFECEKWHLNRLFTLIRIASIKNQPQKKTGKKESMRRNAALNAARRKRYGSSG